MTHPAASNIVNAHADRSCPGCNTRFPATLEYFHPDNRRPDGLRARCRPCANVRPEPRRMLPAAPLRDLMAGLEATVVGEWAGMPARSVYRVMYEVESVRLETADRLCIALGTHLSLVYPWDEQEAAA